METDLLPRIFPKVLARYKPGDRVQVSFLRDARPMTTAITLGPPLLFDYRIEENPNASADASAAGSVVEWQALGFGEKSEMSVSEAPIKSKTYSASGCVCFITGQQRCASGQKPAVHQATLPILVTRNYSDKSAYNFYAMARSDRWLALIKNQFHLVCRKRFGLINVWIGFPVFDGEVLGSSRMKDHRREAMVRSGAIDALCSSLTRVQRAIRTSRRCGDDL